MFGMDKEKRKGSRGPEYFFDLEKDLEDPGKLRALKEQVEERIQKLKTMMRQGEDKKTFDQSQTLLHGFLAIQKVLQRVNRKI